MSPAQSSGAAATGSAATSAGSGRQKRGSATVHSAKPPGMSRPVKRARSQRFSRPVVQYRQTPHVQPSHGMPTSAPVSWRSPTIWCPGVTGYAPPVPLG